MKTTFSPTVSYLLQPQKGSSTRYQAVIDERAQKAYLIQRIELLEMENEELRRRDQNHKKINLTLTEALAKVQHEPKDLKYFISQLLQTKKDQTIPKQVSCKQTQTQIRNSVHFEAISPMRDNNCNPQENRFLHTVKSQLKNSFAFDEQDCHLKYLDFMENAAHKNLKTKPYQVQKLNISSYINQNYGTPIRQKITLTPKKKVPQRAQSYLQKPTTHRSSIKSARGRNVATDLLCDICGDSFSPIVFLSHVQECEVDNNNQSSDNLQKISDAHFSSQQEQQEDESYQVLQMLQSRKKKICSQIEKLKKTRGSPERKKRLETDLDQIVFIIKNKKTLNDGDIKRLLKQKNYYEKYFR